MIRLPLDRSALLAEALGRFRDRRDIAQALARLGPNESELAACIGAATDCVQRLANPGGAVICVRLRELGSGLDIESFVDPAHPDARGFVYLLTAGYDSRDAMAWLDGDYTSYHLQNSIARELVFALGRHVSRWLRAERPDWHFARRVLRGDAGCTAGVDHQRISSRVAPLLSWFGGCTLGVGTTSSGELVPLHSVLGVMLGKRARAVAHAAHQTAAAPQTATGSRRPTRTDQSMQTVTRRG